MTFYEQYGAFAILALLAIALYAVIMLLNRLMRPTVPSPLKLTTYECGVEAVGTGWSQMNIRYYVFAFLFVIFDVESVFLFPWALILGGLEETGSVVTPTFALVEMFIFIGVLAIGLVYAWRKKVLVWE
ncbi:MAG: NADH-quinone oxidoreductase subunit A [Nitriliruptorales bacterium]|nr:NADH-quinone oxidoreductase subunit A [Nitriliruptorales bacterium]